MIHKLVPNAFHRATSKKERTLINDIFENEITEAKAVLDQLNTWDDINLWRGVRDPQHKFFIMRDWYGDLRVAIRLRHQGGGARNSYLPDVLQTPHYFELDCFDPKQAHGRHTILNHKAESGQPLYDEMLVFFKKLDDAKFGEIEELERRKHVRNLLTALAGRSRSATASP